MHTHTNASPSVFGLSTTGISCLHARGSEDKANGVKARTMGENICFLEFRVYNIHVGEDFTKIFVEFSLNITKMFIKRANRECGNKRKAFNIYHSLFKQCYIYILSA